MDKIHRRPEPKKISPTVPYDGLTDAKSRTKFPSPYPRGVASTVRRHGNGLARWRSGYAAACKAVYTGSIPVRASNNA